MSTKEATVYIVDVGKDMGEKRHGRTQTDLEWAMTYVWDRIATDVGTGRKTLYTGVVAFRTDVDSATSNELYPDEDGSYKHLSVVQELGQMLMPNVRSLTGSIKPSNTNSGDAISAVVLAVHMINTFCKHLKYIKKIVLVTNGTGLMDQDMLTDIAKKISEDDIRLIVLGADFNDPEYGSKEEDKGEIKAENEAILRKLTDSCGGAIGTLDQAVTELGIPQTKPVRPIVSYKGYMTLGNPDRYETAMCIDVERYPRTMVARPLAASNFVMKSAVACDESKATITNGDAMEGVDETGLALVHDARTYEVKDEKAPGGKRDVKREDLAKSYEYGRTLVPISNLDESTLHLETKAGLEILGFVPKSNYKHFMNMSRSYHIIPQRSNEKAGMAFASFVHALYELESYAVARLVVKNDKDPALVLLAAHDLGEYECLYEIELPFAEDIRTYRFPPLDRIVTLSGKVLKEHRNLPSDAVLGAMDSFVDAMDISAYDKDDQGNPAEYLPLDENYSPMLHRINQVVRHRAVHPDAAVPPPHEILMRATQPPKELLKRAAPALSKLREAANVKKVPPKALSRKRGARAPDVPLSGLDISDLLSTRRTSSTSGVNPPTISPHNAIPEFIQTVDAAAAVETIHAAVAQFAAIIEDWIRHSLGDANYMRAVEGIRVMRTGCVQMEEPAVFNEWMQGFKAKVLGGQLGGDRREFWWGLRGVRVGLIDKRGCAVSDVGEDEAREFFSTT